MKLYQAATTTDARHVIDHGFVGRSIMLTSGEIADFVQFRDLPPAGLTSSRTAEVEATLHDDQIDVRISGGEVLVDDLGDFVLCIDVPDDVARDFRVAEEPPSGWPFQEYWLSPEWANAYRHTLVVFDSDDGEEVRPDLVGR